MNDIKLGIYQHFKEKKYEVIGVARNSETLEEMLVYKALYDTPEFGKNSLWVRPLKMFTDYVEKDNYSGPRFRFLE